MNSAAINIRELNGLGRLFHAPEHVIFLSESTLHSTGSCVWNGGMAPVNGWLNLKVSGATHITDSPASTLQHYARAQGITQPLAGMMTAASMDSLRVTERSDGDGRLACLVTAGIQNARRAGDPADEQPVAGTINITLVCNQRFTPAAAIEALLVATEAKTAACHDLAVVSPVSGKLATGTGTDSICLLSALEGNSAVEYCGKHTRLGEWIGGATYDAVLDSVRACLSLLR